MVAYAIERLSQVLAEVEALVPAQWAEMAQGFDRFVARPQWELYLRAEELGSGVLITAREADMLVGYFGLLVYPHLSMRNTMSAMSAPYYVIPCPARGFILRRLIERATEEAIKRGAEVLAIKTHVWASAAPILEKMQFREVESWYMLDCGEKGRRLH